MLDWHPIDTIPIPENKVVLVWAERPYNEVGLAIVYAKGHDRQLQYYPAGGPLNWQPTHWVLLPKIGPTEA